MGSQRAPADSRWMVCRVLVRLTTQARAAGPDTVPVSQWLHNSHPRSSEG